MAFAKKVPRQYERAVRPGVVRDYTFIYVIGFWSSPGRSVAGRKGHPRSGYVRPSGRDRSPAAREKQLATGGLLGA